MADVAAITSWVALNSGGAIGARGAGRFVTNGLVAKSATMGLRHDINPNCRVLEPHSGRRPHTAAWPVSVQEQVHSILLEFLPAAVHASTRSEGLKQLRASNERDTPSSTHG
mmetsp:Transcript_18036/g.37571  ORF Transcript_18036/g.37571 Transcript_18036/m.37571 type:complete len:112 (+) Transcript_18036:871-1206(+)